MWCRSHKLGVAQWLQREGRWSRLKRLIGARIYRATTSNWVSQKPVGTVIKTHKGESQPGIRIYKQWKEGATIQDVTKSACEYIKTPAQDELLKKASGSWTGRGTIMDEQALWEKTDESCQDVWRQNWVISRCRASSCSVDVLLCHIGFILTLQWCQQYSGHISEKTKHFIAVLTLLENKLLLYTVKLC